MAGSNTGMPIRHVAGVQRLAEVERSPAGTLIVVLEPATQTLSGYELDVAIRYAVARELAGVVLTTPSALPVTTTHLAERARLPILGPTATCDGPELLLDIDRFVRGGAPDTLARAETAIRTCQHAAEAGGPDAIRAVLHAAGESLGCHVTIDDTPPADPAVPGAVVVGHQPVARVVADLEDDATRVALPTVAAMVSRLRQSELNRRFAPALTRAELIVQVVLSERAQLPQLVEQAHRLDLPLQHTHVAVWVQVEDTAEPSTHSLVRQRQLVEEAELTALQVLFPRPDLWHVATLGGNLLLVCTDAWASDLHRRARADVEHLLDTLNSRGDVLLTAGMGTPQAGPDGIRQSAAEARVAADSAVAAGRRGAIAETDTAGLRRVLADLYSSPLSRNLLDELLAPLDALGSQRARVAVSTLAAYLDAQGSPTRAAAALHLHPNAVSYRLRWITEALGIDLDDPDTRFAAHLACKVRVLNG